MSRPNWVIRGENLDISAEDFQQFCFACLAFEIHSRHTGGTVKGPPPRYTKDKGMDIEVVISNIPKISKEDFECPLTEDSVSTTCVACKTGSNWQVGLLKDAVKPAPIETLEAGGHFTMLVNQQVAPPGIADFIKKIVETLSNKLGVSEEKIKHRIHLFDANYLAQFYAYHYFTPDSNLRKSLGIGEIQGLYGFEEWLASFQESRFLPEFSPDTAREKQINQLREILTKKEENGKAKGIWVYGPPGVGKTRLVLEALASDPSIVPRVLVSSDFEYGRRAIHESDVYTYNNVILVVDECSPHDAPGLCSIFMAKAQGYNGTLILIGVQEGIEEPSMFSGLRLMIEPLEEHAIQKLVESELGFGAGEQSESVKRILNLSEGYPWFAVLLARALQQDPSALPYEADHWDAAKLAIAGTQREFGNDSARWDSESLVRAKSLLTVMLTRGIDWKALEPSIQNRLGQAVDSTWSEVIRAAEACWRRGIIRQRQNWKYKYVTPKNLARLVAANLLKAPYSLGNRIKEYAPEFRKDLYRQLEVIEVPGELLKELAATELTDMPEVDNPFDLLIGKPVGFIPLQFVAKWQPALTARWIRQIIESSTIEELRSRIDDRRDLVFALAHISHRHNGFEDAEASLFRLAVAENESWANNASGVWSGIFLVAINLTRRKFDARLSILSERVKKGPPDFRLLALEGLDGATSRESASPGYSADDTIDGPWDFPTINEVQEGKCRAWRLLCEITLDQNSDLATKAREIAIHNLRSTLYWGIGEYVFETLSEIVGKWQVKELADLREELDSIKRYESPVIEEDANLKEAFVRLRTKAEAVDYHGRLLDVVGRWSPGDNMVKTEPIDGYGKRLEQQAEKLDQKLAEEGLARPMPLVNELEWLESDEAKRGVPFMIHVGMLDSKRVLLRPLIEHAEAGGVVNIMSAYLAGIARSGQEEVVDELLRSWRDKPSLALHTLLIVWRVGPSDERINWLIEDLESGSLDPNAVGCLAIASWGQRAKAKPMKNLIETLAKFPDVTPQITALDLLVERPAPEVDSLEPTLIALVSSLATKKLTGMSDYVWELGCKLGLKRRRVEEIVKAAATAIRSTEDFGSDEHAWKVLVEAVGLDPTEVWNAIAPFVDMRDKKSYRIMLESRRYTLVSQLPIDFIMDWIGSDTNRSIIIANMSRAHETPLNEIARQLIIKFGADSPPAHVLASRAHSTPGVVSSFAEFAKSQLENAKRWAEDSDPQVAKWGKERVAEFQVSYEAESAREEFEEREHQ